MMDFMDSLRRGVDRAGFEVDRLLRANRVRTQIGVIRSQIDEELRLIGREVKDLYERGEPLPDPLRHRCEQIRRYESEITKRELELQDINEEIPPDVENIPTSRQPLLKCPTCGHAVHLGAKFCANCGADLSPREETAQPEAETTAYAEPVADPSDPPAPAG